MTFHRPAFALALASALLACTVLAPAAHAQPAGHITGVGGIFVQSPHPEALAAWYRDVLGIHIEPWGGAILRTDAPGHPPMALWSAFPPGSSEFASTKRDFVINFAVDDLPAFLSRLQQHSVTVLKRDDSDPNGHFAWILDPDGTKIELWQPKPK